MAKTTARKKKRTCAYCGKFKRVNYDHIPPRGLFARPLPNKMITVPACEKCHADTSKDDEYFRTKLSMKSDAYDHPDAAAAWASAFRGLKQPGALGFAKSVLSDIRRVPAQNEAGLIVPRTGYDVDLTRMGNVIMRIVRGLYFSEVGAVLPADHKIAVITQDQIPDLTPELLSSVTQILQELAVQPIVSVGNDVFQFRYKIEAESTGSAWEMMFYRSVAFLAIAAP